MSRGDLGTISWVLLHTMAANYADKETEPRKELQSDLLAFWQSFSHLYPCGDCAKHMRNNLAQNKEYLLKSVKNHRNYNIFVCNFHNIVNKQLKKPKLDCNYEILMKQWKSDEYCGCDNNVAINQTLSIVESDVNSKRDKKK